MRPLRILFAALLVLLPVERTAAQQAPLRFVGPDDLRPLSYMEGGEPRGFDVDLARAIGRQLNREVRVDLMSATDAQRAVLEGEADAHIDLSPSDERLARWAFSDITATHAYGLFVRRGSEVSPTLAEAEARTVGVRLGGFSESYLRGRPNVRIVPIDGFDDGLDRLKAGALDAVASEIWSETSAIERRRMTDIELAGAPFSSQQASIATRKDDVVLLEALNGAIRALKADGRLNAIEEKWRPQQVVFASRARVQELIGFGVAVVLLLILGALSLWAFTLRRQVRARREIEAQLRDTNERLELSLAAADMGTWRWTAATNLWTSDPSLNRMYGRVHASTTEDISEVLMALHPEDRDRVRHTFDTAVRERRFYLADYRLPGNDGSMRTLRSRGKVFCDAAGEPEYATGVVVDITAEVGAAARDRLLTQALRTASDYIIITNPALEILFVNSAALQAYGFAESELVGRHISIIVPPAGVVIEGEQADGWRGEAVNRDKSGREFPVALSMSVLRDGNGTITAIVSVARDITEDRKAQDALRASEAKFSLAFESSPDAITIADLDGGGILMVNEAFERITGFARHEVIGRTAKEIGLFVQPELRDPAVARIRAEGVTREYEFQLRRKNGELATIQMSGATLTIEGRTCLLTVSRDISVQKRFELHLRQAAEVNRLLLTETDLDGLAVAVIEAVHKILPLEYAGLVVLNLDTGTPQLRAQRGKLDVGRSKRIGLALASQARTVNDARILREADLRALGEPFDELPEAGVLAVCALPLITAQGRLGVLTVGSASANAFDDDDVTLLYQLATHVAIAIQNAIAFEQITTLKEQLSQEKLYLEEEIRVGHNFADIVGESAAIRRVLQQIETVAPTDASVLILGETGTGKELLARAVHELSSRSDRTFVKLNVAALPATLLESELFGFERGAFTGANTSKVGRMELAHRGTLFLDEVGDIPLEIQPKLLRVLQEREFERLGSNRTVRADVRLIAATNRDLQQMVAEGTFRSDLYYRLHVFPLFVPPLRERREDIPPLVRYFVRMFASRLRRTITSIPSSTMSMLQEWHWPGNIRELENVIERAVILSTGDVLQVPPFQVPTFAEFQPQRVELVEAPPLAGRVAATMEAGERDLILRALRDAGGTIAGPDGAAARLGLKRTTLQSKMRKLGIRRPTF